MDNKFIYEIDGQKGQILKLYEDRCVISVKNGLKTLFTKDKSALEKIFYFKYVTDIRLSNKTSGGMITFEYQDPDKNPLYDSGNCFEFGAGFTTPMYGVVSGQMDHVYEDVVKYWKSAIQGERNSDSFKKDSDCCPSEASSEIIQEQPSGSVADELLKFKQLLDMGAITQEEYEAQKDKLLHS